MNKKRSVMAAVLKRHDVYGSFFSENRKIKENGYDRGTVQAKKVQHTLYKTETYPDIATLERESSAFYQLFLDSQHEPERLEASGVIEMLAFSSQLLLMHYQSYSKQKKVAEYEERLTALEKYVNGSRLDKKSQPDSLSGRFYWVVAQTKEKFSNLWELLCGPGLLRDELGWTNLTRIFWIFYHFCLNEMMLIVKNAPFLESLGKLLGRPIDLDAISKAFNAPNDVLNVLSVAFFAVRLIIDVIMLAKHTMHNEGLEGQLNTTWQQRFSMELDKRWCNIANCIIWGSVNAVTNYSTLFGIPSELAMPIVACVLFWDLALSGILWYREYVSHNQSMNALGLKISALDKNRSNLSPNELLYLKSLKLSLEVLSKKWAITHATFQLNTAAALIMMTSFIASLIVVNPLLILTSYLVCCLSLSLYASAANGGDYEKYLEASSRLAYASTQPLFNALMLDQLKEEKANAWSTLVAVVFERAFAPLSLFMLTAINPIIGLTAVIGYLGYKINEGYVNAVAKNNEKPVILNQFSLFKDKCGPKNGAINAPDLKGLNRDGAEEEKIGLPVFS